MICLAGSGHAEHSEASHTSEASSVADASTPLRFAQHDRAIVPLLTMNNVGWL